MNNTIITTRGPSLDVNQNLDAADGVNSSTWDTMSGISEPDFGDKSPLHLALLYFQESRYRILQSIAPSRTLDGEAGHVVQTEFIGQCP